MGADEVEKDSLASDEVRSEIDRAREQVASSVRALRQQVAMSTDWRAWVRQKPGLCLAGAFAVGFLMAKRFH